MGAVGVPVWLWTDPWETQSTTITIRTYTLTIDAVPTQVVWSMGEGGTVICNTAGTVFNKAYGVTKSPDCGYVYDKTSGDQPGQSFNLSASMNWQVDWSGVITGSTTTNTTETVPVRIGEYQTVIVN